jgi:hypothetical protein
MPIRVPPNSAFGPPDEPPLRRAAGALREYAPGARSRLPVVGQHSNNRMTSFYMKTPSGFALEYGWGGVLVDDAVWRVTHHSTTKLWGHEPTVSLPR